MGVSLRQRLRERTRPVVGVHQPSQESGKGADDRDQKDAEIMHSGIVAGTLNTRNCGANQQFVRTQFEDPDFSDLTSVPQDPSHPRRRDSDGFRNELLPQRSAGECGFLCPRLFPPLPTS